MKGQQENQRRVFVVHKHQATTLHYDFRLEIGGVMRTTAVPRGPTLDPRLKRLAMPITDHALDHRHFEGVLEEGQYGAGPVMVWDEGTSVPEREKGKGI
jgi:bifunctional non-homologous end joining protein LigD